MKVKELREKLAEFPDNMEVETEGCDCIGGITKVDIWTRTTTSEKTSPKIATVLLERN